jgi:hypothetical protein
MKNMYKKEYPDDYIATHKEDKTADENETEATLNFRLPSASDRAPPNRLPPLKLINQNLP